MLTALADTGAWLGFSHTPEHSCELGRAGGGAGCPAAPQQEGGQKWLLPHLMRGAKGGCWDLVGGYRIVCVAVCVCGCVGVAVCVCD